VSALADTLVRMRREAGVPTTTPGRAPALIAPRIPEHVFRALGLRDRALAGHALVTSADRTLPGIELCPGLRLVEHWVPMHGEPRETDNALAAWGVPPDARWLAFDTETTGLSGGTGTRAFMIGAAEMDGDRLWIRQWLITTLAAEADLLKAFAACLTPDTWLVSYNGRCYDAPLLVTRYRLARQVNPLAGLPHLDLLHPVRRRWRGVWPNCRLATAERELLGVVREDDLPGSEAPGAWRRYLQGGSSKDLRRVLDHNAQDVRSLAGILGCAPTAFCTPVESKRTQLMACAEVLMCL